MLARASLGQISLRRAAAYAECQAMSSPQSLLSFAYCVFLARFATAPHLLWEVGSSAMRRKSVSKARYPGYATTVLKTARLLQLVTIGQRVDPTVPLLIRG